MSHRRWKEVEAIYLAAVDLDPEDREAFLRDRCGDDPEILAEVEALLTADSIGEELDELPAVRVTLEDPAEGRGGRPRERIGPYSIERELGRGGMGRVYLGRRWDDDFDRQVAIKILKGSGGNPEAARRFLLERQILADLDHPSIARLFDGGTSDDGLPYLVMELVEGTPIDEYCDRLASGVGERLSIFEKICAAVAYAHQNLVVHRDLKPDNIFITDEGEPKLLDFGIAKLLRDTAEGETTVGSPGPMTPSYASPEQLHGGPITTASDVFSLGAVLYWVLAGRTPLRSPHPGGRDSGAAVGGDLVPPSRAIGAGEADAETVAGRRGVGPARLRRRLEGDLDAIVLKALRDEPEHRYSSVESFSDDLRRHRQGLPVEARRDGIGYRIKKFVRRHRLGVAAASLSVLFVVVTAVMMSVMAARISRERDRVLEERDKAQRVSEFLIGVYEAADPLHGAGSEASAKEILDRGAQAIREGMAAQPEVRAALLDAMGRAYFNLGLFDRAEPLLAEALGLRRKALGEEHPETAASLGRQAQLLREQGDFERAEELQEESLRILKATLGADHPEVVEGLGNLGWVKIRRGDPAAAEVAFREALGIGQRELAESDPTMIEVHRNLAIVHLDLNRPEEAQSHFRRAVDLGESWNPEHPNLLAAKKGFAQALIDKDELAEAERLCLEVVEAERRIFGPEHPRVAFTLSYLGAIRRRRGNSEGAGVLLAEALEIRRKSLGPRHPAVSVTLVALGKLAHQRGNLTTAEKRYSEALEIARPNPPNGSLGLSYLVGGLGGVLLDLGRAGEAEPLLREALELRIETFRENHPLIDKARVGLARCLIALDSLEPAEVLLREAGRARSARGDTSEIGLEAALRELGEKRVVAVVAATN